MNVVKAAVDAVLAILELAIFVRAISSWLPIPQNSKFISILYQITEPVIAPIRKMLNKSRSGASMMMDFSPIIAILLLVVLRNVLGWIL